MNDKPLQTDTEAEEASEGQEDVAGELSLEELNEQAGRTGDNSFKSKEDFFKHYDNLNSLVGDQKRVEAEKKAEEAEVVTEENKTLAEKLSSLETRIEEKDFLTSNPDAKDSLDLVRAVAKDKGLTLDKAWDTEGLKDLVEAKNARESETEIGVNSKNRLNSSDAKKVGKLADKIQSGESTEADELELLRNFPGAL